MNTKFDVEKFFRANDLGLWKFKMVDRGLIKEQRL